MSASGIQILFIPKVEAARPEMFEHAVTAVIDTLRATTTITAALQAGCSRILACATVAQAQRQARALKAHESVILAGERGGKKIPGFNLGNSPTELKAVAGKTVVLTTSNGTRALHAARHSDLVLAVCLNNLTRSAALLLSQAHRKIVILAAGESGSPAEEDTLTAGLLLDRLVKAADRHKKKLVWDAAAGHILDFCRVIEASHCQEKFLQNAPHGRDLVRLGFQKDIRFAARLDVINLVGMATVSGIRVARV